ncbi:MAG: YdcF family protein [Defluviitaleaceae bacterium]|nr:YdcF family protein [Defluviitaleaceae bacterium]
MNKVFLIIGILAFLNFLVLLFVTGIHFGHVFLGISSVAVIGYGLIFDKIPQWVHITIWTVCVVPIALSGFLAVYGRTTNLDYTEDVVIVLGAGLRHDEEVGTHLATRLDTAIIYLNQNPNAIVITSGGLGAGRTITEAEAMSRYLIRHGIAPERIIQEGKSTSTHENLVFSNEILSSYFPDGFRAVLVTNDFHIYRSVRTARNIGINVTPLGAPTPWHTIAANYARETLAVLHMWVFG